MQDEKTAKIIEAIHNMSDREADILDVFISGFRAGKQVSGREISDEPAASQTARAG